MSIVAFGVVWQQKHQVAVWAEVSLLALALIVAGILAWLWPVPDTISGSRVKIMLQRLKMRNRFGLAQPYDLPREQWA